MLKITNKDTGNCAVCNEIASGIHYGVSTCEGCKGFFRRIITTCANDNIKLSCSGPLRNQCIVAFRIRNLCQRCRLQKCLNVGMTRKHSKLGRKRKLEQDTNNKSPKTINQNILLSDEEMNAKIQNENTYFLREIGIMSKFDAENNNLSEAEDESRITCSTSNPEIIPNEECWYSEQEHSYRVMPTDESNTEYSFIFSPTLAKFWKSNGKIHINEEMKEEAKGVFKLMAPLAYMNDRDVEDFFIQINNFFYLMDSSDVEYATFLKFRKDIPRAHLETCTVTEPIMEKFFNHQYNEIPTDENADNVWRIILGEIEPITNNVISFCKKIPEFESVFSCTDTVNIIKFALFEIVSLRLLRLVDLDNNQFYDPGLTRKIPSMVMAQNPLGPLILRYFYVVAFVKKHLVRSIDDYEMAFLSALCLTLPGWDSSQIVLVNVAHLNRMRFYCSLCLYDHLLVRRYKGNVDETRKRMRKLFLLLDKIKIVNKIQSDILLYLMKNQTNIDKLPVILKHIFFSELNI